MTVSLVEGPIVRQCVVVEKETRANVEGDKDVNRVVLMGGENEEDAKEVEHPGERVHEVQLRGCVYRKELVRKMLVIIIKIRIKRFNTTKCSLHSVMKKLSNVRTTVWPLNM